MERRLQSVLLIAFILFFCILAIPHGAFAEETSLPIPHPDQFPGEREAAYYSVLEDKVRQYGIGAEGYFWETHYSDETGVVWAKMVDLAGDGTPELAVIYDQESDNAEESSWMLEIYNYENSAPVCIYTEHMQYLSYQVTEIDGSMCLEFRDSEGNQKILTIKDGQLADLAPYETEQAWKGYRFTAYLDSEGGYHCISPDLADTIEQMSGVRIGSMNPDNSDWAKLYAAYIDDLIDHDTEEYHTQFYLYDIDGDGIRELIAYLLNPTVASSEDETGSVVTVDKDRIHILEFHALGIMVGDGQFSVSSHVIGVNELQRVFSLTEHRFSLDQQLEWYSPGGFGSGDEHYRENGTEISKSEYEAKMEAIKEEMDPIASIWEGDEYDYGEEGFSREDILDYLNSMSGETGLNGGNKDGNNAEDDSTSLIGQQVPGSEACTDMNSGYAFAIRNMIDLYGLEEYSVENLSLSPVWEEGGGKGGEGVCWAGLFSVNAEQLPYLCIVRWDVDYQESFYQYLFYIYSWEGGKLILTNSFGGYDFWIADMNGKIGIICGGSAGGDYLVHYPDSSVPFEYYGEESEESGEEYSLYLKASRISDQSIRYLIGLDGSMHGYSAQVGDLYLQLSGGNVLPEYVSWPGSWKTLYQQLIHMTETEESFRYSFACLDDDQIPELVIKNYSDGGVFIITSDGNTADVTGNPDDTIVETADRLGSILLLSTGYMEEGQVATVYDVAGGRSLLKGCGCASVSKDLYAWSGILLGSGEEGQARYQSQLDQMISNGMVILRPKHDAQETLNLLETLEPETIQGVADSLTEEEEQALRKEYVVDYPEDHGGYSFSDETESDHTESADTADGNSAQQAPPSESPLTEEEKEVFADFLSDELWMDAYRPDVVYGNDIVIDYPFCLADVTGDGHPELAVQGIYEYDRPGDTYFYRVEDGEIILIGGIMAGHGGFVSGFSSPGYSSALHRAYAFYNERENSIISITVFEFDGTEADCEEITSAEFFSSNACLNGMVSHVFKQFYTGGGQISYSIDGTDVSREEFEDRFKGFFGDPVPWFRSESEGDSWTDRIGWDGFEPIAAIENTPENRVALFGYEGTSDEEYDEEYEEEYADDTGEPYTGPADLADAQSDWDAVNEAGLTSGDPVTVPGDFYTDSQERYKETGYILPQSATQYLTEEDIAHLTMKGCCYARNEIYARHGRLFNAAELQDYFDSRSWYNGTISPDSFDERYTQSVFNEYEYANAYFLLKYENEHGMYWPE